MLWTDINPMVAVLLLAEIGCEVFEEFILWGIHKLTGEFFDQHSMTTYDAIQGQQHPLADSIKVDLSVRMYCFVFSTGALWIYMTLLLFIGEELMFPRCLLTSFPSENISILVVPIAPSC